MYLLILHSLWSVRNLYRVWLREQQQALVGWRSWPAFCFWFWTWRSGNRDGWVWGSQCKRPPVEFGSRRSEFECAHGAPLIKQKCLLALLLLRRWSFFFSSKSNWKSKCSFLLWAIKCFSSEWSLVQLPNQQSAKIFFLYVLILRVTLRQLLPPKYSINQQFTFPNFRIEINLLFVNFSKLLQPYLDCIENWYAVQIETAQNS